VFVRSGAGERSLPLKTAAFAVARLCSLEIAAGDRLLVRANDRNSGLLNGEIVTIARIESGMIHLEDGRAVDTRRFRTFTHGYAVTSHASQSKTADHVIVAAERLDAKAAYVACSRGRFSCTVHTPDKKALLDRIPDGNRASALDLLKSSMARSPTPDRTSLWTRVKDLSQAVQRSTALAWSRGAVNFKEVVWQACRGHAWSGFDSPPLAKGRDRDLDRN